MSNEQLQESEDEMSTGAVNGSMYNKSMWQFGARMGPASPMNRSMMNVNDEKSYEQSKEYENSFDFNPETNDPMIAQQYTRYHIINIDRNEKNNDNYQWLSNDRISLNIRNVNNGRYSNSNDNDRGKATTAHSDNIDSSSNLSHNNSKNNSENNNNNININKKKESKSNSNDRKSLNIRNGNNGRYSNSNDNNRKKVRRVSKNVTTAHSAANDNIDSSIHLSHNNDSKNNSENNSNNYSNLRMNNNNMWPRNNYIYNNGMRNNGRREGVWESFVSFVKLHWAALLVLCVVVFGYCMYDLQCRKIDANNLALLKEIREIEENIEDMRGNNEKLRENNKKLAQKTVQMTQDLVKMKLEMSQDLETMKQDTEKMKQETAAMKQETAAMQQDADIEKQKRIAMEIAQWRFFINVFNNNSKMGLNQVIDISGNKSKFAADNVINYCECINNVSIKQSKWLNQIWLNYDETSELSKCKQEYQDKIEELREHPDREMYDEQVEMMTSYIIDNANLNMNENENENENEKEKEE